MQSSLSHYRRFYGGGPSSSIAKLPIEPVSSPDEVETRDLPFWADHGQTPQIDARKLIAGLSAIRRPGGRKGIRNDH